MRLKNQVPICGFTLRGADDWLCYMQDVTGAWFYLSTECDPAWCDVPGYNDGTCDGLLWDAKIYTDANVARVGRAMLRRGVVPRSVRVGLTVDDAAESFASLQESFGARADDRKVKSPGWLTLRAQVRALGLTITKRDGEYRVNYERAGEATAYYCNDAEDALGTARVMAQFKEKRL